MRRNQSVIKAVEVLQGVAERPSGISVSDLARAVDIPRVTTGRLLATLADHGLLMRMSDDRYVLGRELARLGQLADYDRVLLDAIRGPLQEVLHVCKETVTFAVSRGELHLEVIFQLDSPHFVTTNWVGLDFSLHASSAGKVLLSLAPDEVLEEFLSRPMERYNDRTIADPQQLKHELSQIRAHGYSELDSEFEQELAGVSVAVIDHKRNGDLIGIVSVTGPAARMTKPARVAAVPVLRSAAAAINAALDT